MQFKIGDTYNRDGAPTTIYGEYELNDAAIYFLKKEIIQAQQYERECADDVKKSEEVWRTIVNMEERLLIPKGYVRHVKLGISAAIESLKSHHYDAMRIDRDAQGRMATLSFKKQKMDTEAEIAARVRT